MAAVARRAASSSPRLSWGVAAAGAGAGDSTVGSAAAGGGRGQPMSVAAAITLLDEVYAFRQPLGGGAGWLLLLHQAWKEVA